MPSRSNSQDAQSPSASPSLPEQGSPSSINSTSSRKLPKFLHGRAKGPKSKEIPVPINSSAARRSSLADPNGYVVDTSPSTSPSSEESPVIPPRSSPLSRNRSASKSSTSGPLPIPHRPASPSPLQHHHDASLPSKLSSWISSPSTTGGISLPQILNAHSNITKHLSLPTPRKKGRLSIGGETGRGSNPASPVSDSSSASSKMKDLGTKKGKSRQFLDKALQYILDTDANNDGSKEDIWLLGQLYVYPIEGLPVESPSQEFPPRLSEDATPMVDHSSMSMRRHSSVIPSSSPTRRRTEGILSAPPAHLRASTGGSVDSTGSSSSASSPRNQASADSHGSASASSASRVSKFLHHPHRQSTAPATPRVSNVIVEPPSPVTGYFVQDPPMINGYPTAFYEDFSSRIWLTYRGGWESPLRADAQLSDLPPPIHFHFNSLDGSRSSLVAGHLPNASSASQASSSLHPTSSQVSASTHESGNAHLSSSASSTKQQHSAKWGNNFLATFGIGSKEFTSDAGWGCMLRTGQCVLAEALSRVHLGRSFRRHHVSTSPSVQQAYVRLLSWFMDTPSPSAPFSVHRMALAGKAFGKEVGTWFGPSTAAGAIKTLVGAFPECGIAVCVAEDGMLYETDVIKASRSPAQRPSLSKGRKHHRHQHQDSGSSSSALPDWGDRPVLVLAGIRLGLDGVNPVYYDSLKRLYTIPQGVGVAGGRPSSSYWFIGVQGNSLIYLDPHHARPAIFGNMLSSSGSSVISATSPTNGDSQHSGSGQSWEEETLTYHCDRVRKIKLNSTDPSMLVGFLVGDRREWEDLRRRISELPKPIGLYIQDEPPAWKKEQDLKEEEEEEEDDSLLESISDSASNASRAAEGGDDVTQDGPDERDPDTRKVANGEVDDRDAESLETAAGPRHPDQDMEEEDDDDDLVDLDPSSEKRCSILAFPSTAEKTDIINSPVV